MHAILGYAASELMHADSNLAPVAMGHRIKAIKAIKKRLTETSKMDTTYEEANALVATCFALTFQSVSLEDGLAEYMTFIRGIVIVGMQMMFKSIKPLFSNLFESNNDDVLAPLMEGLPLIQKGWAETAVESITNLGPLCTHQVEIEYHEKLMTIASHLLTNSFEGRLTVISGNRHCANVDCYSVQGQFEAIRMVDAVAARLFPRTYQLQESSHHPVAHPLDSAVANHGFHQ